MKKLICSIFVICGQLAAIAGDDKSSIVRDPNTGAVVATLTKTATGVTVRDVGGNVTESRQRFGNTLIVRDPAGKVIRKEEKARK